MMRKCRRMRKPKKKINKYWHTMDICGHVDFGYDIRCKRMRERERERNWHRIEYYWR